MVPLGQCSAKVAGEDDGNITRKMFFSFQEEVEKLGVSAMEYKQRRTIENEKLEFKIIEISENVVGMTKFE